nr:leucine-rich repeat receptor-like protein CLAVATA2 [Biomphalaria glabrata]
MAFTLIKALALIVCSIITRPSSDTTSYSIKDGYDKIHQWDDFDAKELFPSRRKGLFQLLGQLDNARSSKNAKNRFSLNVDFSVNSDSMCIEHDVTVDCSNLHLKEINSSWFPNNTELIFLKDNILSKLVNSTFKHLLHLIHLDISNNKISYIEPLAFEGLTSLKYLSLGLMLLPLTQLRNLSISTVTYTLYFEPEFRNLTSLEVLEITGWTQNITNTSFENVSGVKTLILRDMNFIKSMDDQVFALLNNLTSLRMEYDVINLQLVLSLLWPFKGRNMSEIYFEGVSTTQGMTNPMIDGFLTRNDFRYLKDICLNEIAIIKCYIFYITTDAFIDTRASLNRCLRHIKVDMNPLIGSPFALIPFILSENLQTAFVGNALRVCEEFSPFPRFSLNRNYFFEEILHFDLSFYDEMALNVEGAFPLTKNITHETQAAMNKIFYMLNGTLYATIPKDFKMWHSPRLFQRLSLQRDLVFREPVNIEYIDFSDCGVNTLVGRIQGLSSLKTLILSGNDLSNFADYFFDEFFGLENVALSNCGLDRDFSAIKSNRVFQNTTKLKELDLSENSLNTLSKGTFSRNSELIYLSLSTNLFKDIPFDLKLTPNLKTLDISFNVITTLTAETTAVFDYLNSKNGGFQLMLNGNILSCGCHDLPFLHWLNRTPIGLDNNRNYTCMNKDGERTNTLALSDLESLWRQCWGEFFFYVAMITLCLYVIGVFIIFMVLKNKNFFVSYLLQIFGNFKLHTRSDYKTDVYIGYSDEDYRFPCNELRENLETKIKLSTFILDRDLIASLDKASGIVNAMNSCWRILLVCSRSFLMDEDWSMFTIRSAIYAQSPANPARIVIMVHKSSLPLLPTELLSVVNDENIIVVSEWKMNYSICEMLKTRLN